MEILNIIRFEYDGILFDLRKLTDRSKILAYFDVLDCLSWFNIFYSDNKDTVMMMCDDKSSLYDTIGALSTEYKIVIGGK